MADGRFQVSVVTPEATLLDGEASAVILRSSDGELTVLDGHADLVTDVVPGPVRVEQERAVPLAVHGGYLQVESSAGPDGGGVAAGTRVTLLAGVAELADQIDVPRAEAARAAAEAKLEELGAAGRAGAAERAGNAGDEGSGAEGAELRQAEAALRRAGVRLEVAGAVPST